MSKTGNTAAINFDGLFDASNVLEGSTRARLDIEGTWYAKMTEATYGKNQAGTKSRGMLKLEILGSYAGTEDRTGAITNVYVNVADKVELTQRNIAPWAQTLIAVGVSAEKIKEDAVDFDDVIQNIIAISTKQLKLGKEILVKLQTKNDGKGGFYKNIYLYTAPEAVDPIDNAPAVENDPFAV